MDIQKQTVLDRIEINRDGSIGVRMLNQVVDLETGEVFSSEVVRSVAAPGEDAGHVLAGVNTSLAQRGWSGLASDVLDQVRAYRGIQADAVAMVAQAQIKGR